VPVCILANNAFAGSKNFKSQKSHICWCGVCFDLKDKTEWKSTGKLAFRRRKKTKDTNNNVMMEKSKCFDASLSVHQYVSTDMTRFIMLN
jgi:hypothetical protein